jgi:hypothetical protein
LTTLSFSKYSILADRRELLRLAICSTIELLQLKPQKLLCLHYNRSTIHPENDEEPALVEAERLYEKMLENITNKVIIGLSDNTSSMSGYAQKELFGKQAFHPNFDRIENNANNTTSNQVS